MNRIHRFGDNAEIDEKNRVKMYKKGSQWVTANQTSFMLLGKHVLTKGLAILLGTVALGLTSGQDASADSVASTSSGTQPTTGETTNSSDSGSSNTVTLKSSANTSEEDTGTTTSGNSNTDQAASTAVMTNSSAAKALQANLASMSTTPGSLNTDSKSTTTTANEQSAAASTTSNQLTDKSESSRTNSIMAKAATLSTNDSSDASSVIDNAGQNSKVQSGTITLSEMYKNNHLPDLQEKLVDGDRAIRTTEFHPDPIFNNTQIDQDTSTPTINNVWNQSELTFKLNTYVSSLHLDLPTPKEGLFYNLQIDDRLAKHITSIEVTNSKGKVITLLTRSLARKSGQDVADYDDDVYCAKFTDLFPGSDESRTANGVIHFDGLLKDILSQTTDNDFEKLPLGYRSYVSYEGNTAFTSSNLIRGDQNYPSHTILGASYTNGFFITPTQHILDSTGKDEGMDGGYIGAPMFYGFAQKGIFVGGTDDVYYDVKNRAIVIDNYINRKSKFTYNGNGWKYDLKIDPRLLPFIKVEQTRDAQWNPVTSYGNVERIYFKNGTYSTHYTREEIRNQSNDATADLVKETRKLYRDPQDGEFVADLNNVAPDVEETRPWIIRTVLPLGEDSQGRLYTLTSILKSIFENTADSAKQPALQFQTYLDNGYGKMIEGTASSNLSSFAELANNVSDNTEDQGLFVIDFVDENQTAQGAFTLEGKAGSTQEFTADFPDGWTFAGDPSKLPNGWTINSQGQLTGTATMQSFNSAQATWLLVKHGEYTVTHNAASQGKLAAKDETIPGTSAKKFAQDINYNDLNKTLTRTIKINYPHGDVKTIKQTVDFARDAVIDMVTGEIISYTPWQAVDPSTRNYDTEGKYNYYDQVDVPTVAGYTPSQTTVEKVYPNGASDADISLEITYTAISNPGTQTIEYQYVKDDGSTDTVGKQVISGQVNEEINDITWKLPDGYVLADGESLPSSVTIQKTDTPRSIKVKHLIVQVSHTSPQDDGTLIPGTTDKHFKGVAEEDLNRTIWRYLDITYPDGHAEPYQKENFVRDAEVDAVTGKVTYTKWSKKGADYLYKINDSVNRDIDGYTKIYKVNGNLADSTALDLVTPNDDGMGNIVAVDGGVTVTNDDIHVTVTYLDWRSLRDAINAAPVNKKTEKYLNASAEKAKVYDDAVTAGQSLLDKLKDKDAGLKYSKNDVDNAVNEIQNALNALDGQPTDYDALQKAVAAAPDNQKTDGYLNASDPKAYDKAVADGQKLLDEQKAGQAHSQTDVNNAVKAINAALNGQPTDYDALQKAVAAAPDNRKTEGYLNASNPENYDNAVADGQKLLDEQKAGQAHSQTDVNNAVKAINDALNALDGQPTDYDALQKAVAAAPDNQKTDGYLNASDPKAYDKAVADGQKLLDEQKAGQAHSQTDVNNAVKAINAALDGQPTDKDQLQKDVDQGNQIKQDDSYKNADQDKQKVLDNAIKQGQDVLNDPNADQKTVNEADQAIKDALKNLDGQPTDKSQLQKDVNQGSQTKQDDAYKNAGKDKQKALDDVIKNGQDVLNDPNADQKTVDEADQAIKEAIKNLDGKATDKSQLQKDVDQGNQSKQDDAYKNANEDKQKALNDAIKHGQDVLNDPNADQKTVDEADQAIKDALKNLDGQPTDKSQLEKDVEQGNQSKQDDSYKNADQDKQKVLDNALKQGQDVLNDPNVDQKTVDEADQAIKDAIKDLNGQPTDKDQLQKDIDQGKQTKQDDQYRNADQDKQKALDDVLKHGQDVLNDPNVDQKTVDEADQAIKNAIKDLNGQPTDKDQLQKDINQGSQTKQDDAYKNANEDKQKALDDVLKHGQDVLNDPNADQKTVDEADQAIKDAIKDLNSQSTDKSQLEKDVEQGNQSKQDDQYRNADQDKQKTLDDAIKQGQDVLNDPNADQKTVDNADQAIKDAIKNLNGQPTDKSQLEKNIEQGNQSKQDDAYKNADEDKQKALDDAIKHGQNVLNDPNADQKTVDDADQAIKDALKDLNGQPTDKSQLQKDVDQGSQIKQDNTYKNANEDKQNVLDDAIKHGQDVLNDPNADQKTVDEAAAELEQAIKAIEAEFNNGENAKNINSQGRAGDVNGSNHSVATANQKQNNKSTLETLPQTGNQQSAWAVFAGLIATVMSSLMMLLGIKKGNDDKEKN